VRFTVLGASGFIGSHIVAELRRRGVETAAPQRYEWDDALRREAGHVIYCAGLTADFRVRGLDAVRAHVCRLLDVLAGGGFLSLLYLSSARLYLGGQSGSESSTFVVDPRRSSDLYNLSKLTGESLCLSRGDARIRVARLSNVYGPDWRSDNFLMSVIRAGSEQGAVEMHTALESRKDYISIEEAVPLLIAIAERGKHDVYNVASGVSTSNSEIAGALERLGVRVTVRTDAPVVAFPALDTSRIGEEFWLAHRAVTADLPQLIEAYGEWRARQQLSLSTVGSFP
jgi:nucleoside-diphosphate-sugar epimerase